MKISIFAEGCYPYVAGGVSGWLQMLMEELSENKFIVYTLVPWREEGGKFKYDIPSNVLEIRETYLMEKENWGKRKKIKLTKEERSAFRSLLFHSNVQWGCIFDFFERKEVKKICFPSSTAFSNSDSFPTSATFDVVTRITLATSF